MLWQSHWIKEGHCSATKHQVNKSFSFSPFAKYFAHLQTLQGAQPASTVSYLVSSDALVAIFCLLTLSILPPISFFSNLFSFATLHPRNVALIYYTRCVMHPFLLPDHNLGVRLTEISCRLCQSQDPARPYLTSPLLPRPLTNRKAAITNIAFVSGCFVFLPVVLDAEAISLNQGKILQCISSTR